MTYSRGIQWLLCAASSLVLAACTGTIGDGGPGGGSGDGDGGGSGGGDGGLSTVDARTWPTGDAGPFQGVRAFPGAEGFGALATGGRGGRVIKVTTLAASGPGSLQEALNQDEPRIVVFDVSGVIEGDIEVPYGNLTIAGQTAPGGGITIKGRLTAAYDSSVRNMIIRHIRVRPEYDGSSGEQFDAVQFSRNRLFIFDHVSVSFGVDENVDLYSAQDVTIQWSSIESSATNGHPEGEHNYGLLNGPDGARISVHHNLFVHHKNRCPAIANGPAEVMNNVMYNVRHGFVHHNPATGSFNIVGNYFRDGPSGTLIPFYFDTSGSSGLGYHLSDNYVDDPSAACQGVINNPWTECNYDLNLGESYRAASAFNFAGASEYHVPVSTQSAESAYAAVLDGAGAFPRDVVTRDCVQHVRDRGGSWGANQPADLMAGLTPSAPPVDADNDGMADDWELARGLDPTNGSDHNTEMDSGYTAIEAYINELAAGLR